MKIRNGKPIFTARQVAQGGGDLIKDLIEDKLEVVDLRGYKGASYYRLRDYAFYNKKKLKKIILDNSKEVAVGQYCFNGSNVETLQGLSKFGVVEQNAFKGTNIKIQPFICTAIVSTSAFLNCSKITGTLQLAGERSFTIFDSAFLGTNIYQISIPNTNESIIKLNSEFYKIFPNTITKIKVRSSMLDKYKADSNWSKFTGIWEAVNE